MRMLQRCDDYDIVKCWVTLSFKTSHILQLPFTWITIVFINKIWNSNGICDCTYVSVWTHVRKHMWNIIFRVSHVFSNTSGWWKEVSERNTLYGRHTSRTNLWARSVNELCIRTTHGCVPVRCPHDERTHEIRRCLLLWQMYLWSHWWESPVSAQGFPLTELLDLHFMRRWSRCSLRTCAGSL